MTDHEHHHHDGEECHCHDHDHHDHEHHHEHDHEATSIEQAGGCAVGLTGTITCWNADAEARFAKALERVGKWVEHEAGCMLGHIKAAITLDDGTGMTLNLINMENGVEHHGSLEPSEKVNFTFMCAVLDVDEHDLRHMMFHAVDDTGLDYHLDEHIECHCHDHDHDHEHEECHCHDHEHEHHHHHHDGEECHCHDHDHEHHDHEHGECHCHDHDHHHHHDGE